MKHTNNGKCPKCREMMIVGNSGPILVDEELRQWFEDLQANEPEVHLADTYRDRDGQTLAYNTRKSKAQFGQSPHNYLPVMALDLFFQVNGKYSADFERYRKIAKTIPSSITWGGDWNKNGLTEDEKFRDGPHFERTGWKKLVTNYPHGND